MKTIRGSQLIKGKSKPVPILDAHNNEVCGFVSSTDRDRNTLEAQIDMLKKRDIHVYAIARLLMLFGCRVGECLGLTGSDVDKHGRIVMSGSKGSNDRLIVDSEMKDYWLNCRRLSTHMIYEFDRFYVYRMFKAVGILHSVDKKKKRLCTHFPRHLFIKDMQIATNDISVTAQLVGHKSTLSTGGYLKSRIK